MGDWRLMCRLFFLKPFPCFYLTKNNKTILTTVKPRFLCSAHQPTTKDLHGIFPVYKPPNCTSFQVVKKVGACSSSPIET